MRQKIKLHYLHARPINDPEHTHTNKKKFAGVIYVYVLRCETRSGTVCRPGWCLPVAFKEDQEGLARFKRWQHVLRRPWTFRSLSKEICGPALRRRCGTTHSCIPQSKWSIKDSRRSMTLRSAKLRTCSYYHSAHNF